MCVCYNVSKILTFLFLFSYYLFINGEQVNQGSRYDLEIPKIVCHNVSQKLFFCYMSILLEIFSTVLEN